MPRVDVIAVAKRRRRMGLLFAAPRPIRSRRRSEGKRDIYLARAQRTAILASKLCKLDGFCLVVDCGTPGCRGERS